MAQIVSNIPVLPSRDLSRSAEFYARLGYKVVSSFPGYLILFREEVELHLAQMEIEPGRNPSGMYLRVFNVDQMARVFDVAAEDKPWGQREFSVADPDENLIRVGEPTSN